MLGLAGEPPTQLWVLRCHAHRAGVEVALTHHDASLRDERCRCKSEPLGTEKRSDGYVTTRHQLAVNLQDRPSAKLIEHEYLGASDSPSSQGMPAWWIEVSGDAPVPPLVAAERTRSAWP